jgi:hypothetical protein
MEAESQLSGNDDATTCRGTTTDGSRCRNRALPGEKYCYHHSSGLWNAIRYLHRDKKAAFWTSLFVAVILTLAGIYWPRKPTTQARPTTVSGEVAVYLGFDWNHIPIHIPAASTIHVLRLDPGILYGNPNIPSLGVFENIGAPLDRPLDWPSKSQGRFMTRAELQKVMREGNGIPTPYAFHYTVSNYSTSTVEDLVVTLLIDTSDRKRHAYPVAFDPLPPGSSFSFYLVNVCTEGMTPDLVQWVDTASLHVLGEPSNRQVPLKFEKRNWPAELVPPFGPSAFLWNGVQSCQWRDR